MSMSTCPHCNGAGTINTEPCSKCHGSGTVAADIMFDL